jgi:hypothetical protein
VVTSAGSGVDQSTGDSGNEQVVVDEELNSVFEGLLALLEHLVELLSLSDVTGETIENETVESVTSVLEIVRKWKITGKGKGKAEVSTYPSWHSLFSSN